jgi:hypothetical protein
MDVEMLPYPQVMVAHSSMAGARDLGDSKENGITALEKINPNFLKEARIRYSAPLTASGRFIGLLAEISNLLGYGIGSLEAGNAWQAGIQWRAGSAGDAKSSRRSRRALAAWANAPMWAARSRQIRFHV